MYVDNRGYLIEYETPIKMSFYFNAKFHITSVL